LYLVALILDLFVELRPSSRHPWGSQKRRSACRGAELFIDFEVIRRGCGRAEADGMARLRVARPWLYLEVLRPLALLRGS
jgi:hypothetical protein